MKIKHVLQKHKCSCGPACLSMVTGIPYKTVVSSFKIDFWERGMHCDVLDAFLAGLGYAVQRIPRYNGLWEENKPWPPEPWSDVHIAVVNKRKCSHFVVMLKDGTVLDPKIKKPTTLKNPQYLTVANVAAIYKVL